MPKIPKFFPVFCTLIYILAVTLGAFTGGAWASLGIGGAVLLFFGLWAVDKTMPLPPKNFSFFTLTTLWVLGAELPLSSHFAVSLKVWLQLASIFLPLLLLTSPRLQVAAFSRSFIPAVAVAMAVGAVALGLELQSGGFLIHALKKPGAALTEYNRGMAHMVILSFPLFAGLWITGKRKAAAALGLVLLFPAELTESHTAKLALVVGAACTALAFYRPLVTRRLLTVATLVIAGWPFYAQRLFLAFPDTIAKLHNSFRHRIEIWDFLSYRITERPIFGWGLGTTHLLDFTRPHGELYLYAINPAPHAHNFIVELWVETGFPGLALGLAFLLLILRRIWTLHPSLRPFALGGFAAAVTVSMFGFDFWTDALWAAFALSACVLGMLQQQLERKEHLVHA
jgi:O-antigen ligase